MEPRQFENRIRTLLELAETESPVVSHFLDCEDPDGRRTLRERMLAARKVVERDQRAAFERAVERIERHVPSRLDDSARSVAVFARTGSSPLFIVMEFAATVPTQLHVSALPNVFPLVQLEDDYHRYGLMICNEDAARVLEVSLGNVTREVLTRRPELRERVGCEWTKLHYENHRRDRSERFVKEQIALVERIFASGGRSHLMLAGNPRLLARVRRALPKKLRGRLVDVVPASSRDRASDVVVASLSSFDEHEEGESRAAVSILCRELRRDGLAVSGFAGTRDALERGQADQLVVLAGESRELDTAQREELVRPALSNGVHVEVVETSDELESLGGVGCLLRYASRNEPTAAVESVA